MRIRWSIVISGLTIFMTFQNAGAGENKISLYKFLWKFEDSINSIWRSKERQPSAGTIRFTLKHGRPTSEAKVIYPLPSEQVRKDAINAVTAAVKAIDFSQFAPLPEQVQVDITFGKRVRLNLTDVNEWTAFWSARIAAERRAERGDSDREMGTEDCFALEMNSDVNAIYTAKDLTEALERADQLIKTATSHREPASQLLFGAHLAKAFAFYRFGKPDDARRECLSACESVAYEPSTVESMLSLMLSQAQLAWSTHTMPSETIERILLDRIEIRKHSLNIHGKEVANFKRMLEPENADLMRFYIATGNLQKASKVAEEYHGLAKQLRELGNPEHFGKW